MKFFSFFSWAKCYCCGHSGHYICPLCLPKIEIYQWFDYISKKPSKNFFTKSENYDDFPLVQAIVLTHYHQPWIKTLLRHAKFYWKYQAYKDIILPFSWFFHEHVQITNSLLVPVPIHCIRRWKRGFNQSEKISDILSSFLHIPIHTHLLFRKKYTWHQSKLTKLERKIILHSAFFTSKKNTIPQDTIIYLIDDVISSGSTLIECAKTLQSVWFNDIRAIVIASD